MSDSLFTIFLCSSDLSGVIMKQMHPAFFVDNSRFAIASMTATWSDVARDVPNHRPKALVIDASIAPSPDALRSYLTQLTDTIAILVLPQAWSNLEGQFSSIASVRGVFIAPVNWTAVANATYSACVTEASNLLNTSPMLSATRDARSSGVMAPSVIGTRIVAFTSFTGGVGKSTIAEAMAVELARQHIKTLLFSFNSPAAAAGHFDLKFAPSANNWFNRPTPDGFSASLQHINGFPDLDVVVAPNDPGSLAQAAQRAASEENSIRNLIYAAFSFNYGAILIDLPPFADTMWAVQPLLMANVAVIVARPTMHAALSTARAFRFMTKELATGLRVPREAMFVALNFLSPKDNMGPSDFFAATNRALGDDGPCPPLMATFPYVPELPAAQNHRDSPMLAKGCDEFAKPARSLTVKIIGGSLVMDDETRGGQASGGKKSLFSLPKISIK
jgi:cellulose biosynthesis protein BcsQ